MADRLTVPSMALLRIAKFGTPAYRSWVQNELLRCPLAARCGLNVPEHRVVRARDIDRLPEHFDSDQPKAPRSPLHREAPGAGSTRGLRAGSDIAPDDKYVSEHTRARLGALRLDRRGRLPALRVR
ncbi:MAG: hypothetical protein KF850_35705 [Labilithrix sp.]|nr:hypothetical protein [Labilithrix sp.]